MLLQTVYSSRTVASGTSATWTTHRSQFTVHTQ